MGKLKLSFLFLLIFNILIAKESRPKIGLVLSGGGARGTAHVAVIKELEAHNIYPDYITGTSMGAIIGGLYAIGYSVEDLEELVQNSNWNELLFDLSARDKIIFEEKQRFQQFPLSLSYEDEKLQLPRGLVSGQNIYFMLRELTLSAIDIHNFDDFPIPFRCVATDITTGDAVVIKGGDLADALRASMSLPSILNPTEIGDDLLVDGGLVRNFPVQDVIDMGADFVIGVDVSPPLYQREELNSLATILEQSINLRGIDSTLKEKEKCNIFIQPDLQDYNILSFNKIDEILQKGREAVQNKSSELKALSKNYSFSKKKKLKHFEKIDIDAIMINGASPSNKRYIKNLLVKKSFPIEVSKSELIEQVKYLYGTGRFLNVNFKLKKKNNKNHLVLTVKNASENQLNFAIQINNENGTILTGETMLKNFLLYNSNLRVLGSLGEYKNISFSYKVPLYSTAKFDFLIANDFSSEEFHLLDNNKSSLADLEMNQYSYFTGFGSSLSFNSYLKMGMKRTKSRFNENLSEADWISSFDEVVYDFLVNYSYDNLNDASFPSSGIKINSEVGFLKTEDDNLSSGWMAYNLSFTYCFPINDRFTLRFDTDVAQFNKDKNSMSQIYFFGGYEKYRKIYPYYGSKQMETLYKEFVQQNFVLQYKINKSIYVQSSVLNIIPELSKKISLSDSGVKLNRLTKLVSSFSLGIGARTPVGPIKANLGWNDKSNEFSYFLNIGHRF